MMFYKTLDMPKSIESASCAMLKSAYRIFGFVFEHTLADRPHASLWLAKAYVVQLEQLSRPSSQTTWLKVKPHCNLYHIVRNTSDPPDPHREGLMMIVKSSSFGGGFIQCLSPGYPLFLN
eukprot:1147316-Pelagomonas_calceolata.AAC.1